MNQWNDIVEMASAYSSHIKNSEPLLHFDFVDMLRDFPGIYALYDKGECVYVGISSKSVRGRIKAHLNDKRFEYFKFHSTNDADFLKYVEATLIYANSPRYNQSNAALNDPLRDAINDAIAEGRFHFLK